MMSLFSGPDEHAANPPESWQVVRASRDSWQLTAAGGGVIDTYRTRREAYAGKECGRWVTLYDRERRWYAGESVPGWRPWADLATRTTPS